MELYEHVVIYIRALDLNVHVYIRLGALLALQKASRQAVLIVHVLSSHFGSRVFSFWKMLSLRQHSEVLESL